ncbi:MAG: multiubiquitin domain-containing protein [Candidatus Aminicenantales bacterium]
MTTEQIREHEGKGKSYTLFIDDKEYEVKKASLTGAEIMDLGGIPHSIGVVQILEDDSQAQVKSTDVIELKPGHRFKKAPRFRRG